MGEMVVEWAMAINIIIPAYYIALNREKLMNF